MNTTPVDSTPTTRPTARTAEVTPDTEAVQLLNEATEAIDKRDQQLDTALMMFDIGIVIALYLLLSVNEYYGWIAALFALRRLFC